MEVLMLSKQKYRGHVLNKITHNIFYQHIGDIYQHSALSMFMLNINQWRTSNFAASVNYLVSKFIFNIRFLSCS